MKEKRTKRIEISVTQAEFDALQERKTKPRLAEWIRETALGERVKTPTPKADPQLLYELNRVGVNLNQIARRLNTSEPVSNLAVLEVLLRLEKQLKAFL